VFCVAHMLLIISENLCLVYGVPAMELILLNVR